MALFENPLGHAGYPPGVTGTPTTQPASIRAATAAEAATGTLTNCYISPATADSATALDFANPPAAGFGSGTARPVFATTLTSSGNTSLGTGASSVVNVGIASSTLGFFGATAVAKQGATVDLRTALINLGFYTTGGASPLNLNGGTLTAANAALTTAAGTTIGVNSNSSAGTGVAGLFTSASINVDALQCVGGSIKVPAPTITGASPQVNDSRSGQVGFSDIIANGAYGTLTITNARVTAASVIVAMASCTTANSAVHIVDNVPGSGTVAFRLFNAGAASTATTVFINYWVLN